MVNRPRNKYPFSILFYLHYYKTEKGRKAGRMKRRSSVEPQILGGLTCKSWLSTVQYTKYNVTDKTRKSNIETRDKFELILFQNVFSATSLIDQLYEMFPHSAVYFKGNFLVCLVIEITYPQLLNLLQQSLKIFCFN